MKFKLFILSLFLSFVSFAAENPWIKTSLERQYKQPECMIDLSSRYFLNILNKYKGYIEKGDKGGLISPGSLVGFAGSMKPWLKYKYIQLDTGLSKAWLRKIIKIFMIMFRYNREMDIAQKIKNTKRYDIAKEKYKQYYKLLVKTIKSPEKAPRKVREAEQDRKIKEYKAYRKYLEKQEEIENADSR